MDLFIIVLLCVISAPAIMGQTIADLIESNVEFKEFKSALEQANLLETLRTNSANFTVFAPNESVLQALELAGAVNFTSSLGQAALSFHIVPDVVLTSQEFNSFVSPTSFATLLVYDNLAQQVTIADIGSNVIVQSVAIAETPDGDLIFTPASNGIIYNLVSILVPPQEAPPQSPSTPTTVLDEFEDFPISFSAFSILGDLNTSLLDSDDVTLFAPDSTAIGDYHDIIPFDQVVEYHIAAGALSSGQLFDGQVLETLQGPELRVSIREGTLFINQAKLESPSDIDASNGFLHTINKVLVPANALDVLTASLQAGQEFGILLQALEAASFENNIATLVGFTFFAPNDNAFESLAADLGMTIDALLDLPELSEILALHIVPSVETLTEDFESSTILKTLDDDTILLTSGGGSTSISTTFSSANLIDATDILSSNAIIHMIDSVLVPFSLSQLVAPPPPAVSPPSPLLLSPPLGSPPSPLAEPPFVESPFAGPPLIESPFAEPPFAESPFVESPFAEPPFVESPFSEPPFVDSPFSEPPFVDSPFAEPPFAESPFSEPPFVESPFVESPFAEPPLAELNSVPPSGELGSVPPAPAVISAVPPPFPSPPPSPEPVSDVFEEDEAAFFAPVWAPISVLIAVTLNLIVARV